MNLDYSSILKADGVQPGIVANRSLLTAAEADLDQILFSSAFRRLQQHARILPMDSGASSKSSQAIETAHIGRRIAKQIAARLESGNWASATECAALVDFTEVACLAGEVGCPPFGWLAKRRSNAGLSNTAQPRSRRHADTTAVAISMQPTRGWSTRWRIFMNSTATRNDCVCWQNCS